MKRQIRHIVGIVVALLFVLVLAFMTGEQSDIKKTIDNIQEGVLIQTTFVPASSPVTIIPEQEIGLTTEEVQKNPEEDRPELGKENEPEGSAIVEPLVTEERKEAEDLAGPSCTLAICCDEVLKHQQTLAEEKRGIIPLDGWILQEQTVPFTEGETVFDLLLRETKNRGIHFEFVYTPMYHSAYIEGIGNLYEFDCGDTSGWFYQVNGERPMFGCSQYVLQQGDKVEFIYTCNFLKTQ